MNTTEVKNIKVKVTLKGASTPLIVKVPVNKKTYTSFQSSKNGIAQRLVMQVAQGKITADAAVKEWNDSIVDVWHNAKPADSKLKREYFNIDAKVSEAFGEVAQYIDSIESEDSILDIPQYIVNEINSKVEASDESTEWEG